MRWTLPHVVNEPLLEHSLLPPVFFWQYDPAEMKREWDEDSSFLVFPASYSSCRAILEHQD